MDAVTKILLYGLIILNAVILIKILIGKQSPFNPISIFSLAVISQMFPQLYALLTIDYEIDIKILLFMMLACQLAFLLGYKVPPQWMGKEKFTFDFRPGGIKLFIIILACLSIIPMFYYDAMKTVYGGINVVLGFFRMFGTISLVLCCIYLENKQIKSKWFLIAFAVISFLPLFYYAYFVKGSRQMMFFLGFVLFYFLSNRFKKQYVLSILFVILFGVSSFLSASLTEIRRVNNYHEENAKDLDEIEYVENFEESFEKDEIYGWDLGNAAFMIDYITLHSKYDYGASLWNGFIFNYYPQRYFGEQEKNNWYIGVDEELEYYEDFVKGGITTTTGYYSAYRSFSVFGFILFFLLGLVMRILKNKSQRSVFFNMVFLLSITYIPTMITHHIQYMLGLWEFVFLIMLPVFVLFLKFKIINNNG